MTVQGLLDRINELERTRRLLWGKPARSPQDVLELKLLGERIEDLWTEIRYAKAEAPLPNSAAQKQAKKMVSQVQATLKQSTFAGVETYREHSR